MAHIIKRKGRPKPWEAVIVDPGGVEVSKSFTRKADAQRHIDEVTAGMVTGQYVSAAAGKITFKEYAEEWRQMQVHRPTSASLTETVLRVRAYPAFGDRPIDTIKPGHIQAWVKGLMPAYATSTIHVTHGIVASVFKQAAKDRRIFESPCADTTLPELEEKKVTPITVDDVRRLIAALPERYQGIAALAACTGLRVGELLGLTVEYSGLRPPSSQPTLHVEYQLLTLGKEPPFLGPPKRKASRRSIPLPQTGVNALSAHLAAFPSAPQRIGVRDMGHRLRQETVELVFTNAKGKPIRRSSLNEVWKPAARSVCLDDVTPHDLRHFYASLLIRQGESAKVVQARLGHATIGETMDTYTHLWPDAEDQTRKAIDDALLLPTATAPTDVEAT